MSSHVDWLSKGERTAIGRKSNGDSSGCSGVSDEKLGHALAYTYTDLELILTKICFRHFIRLKEENTFFI
jgi:hypothetical protein